MIRHPSVSVFIAVYHPSGVDVHFVGTLRFSDSRLATVETSLVSALQQTYAVAGTEAYKRRLGGKPVPLYRCCFRIV
jgi:hypothetical protein